MKILLISAALFLGYASASSRAQDANMPAPVNPAPFSESFKQWKEKSALKIRKQLKDKNGTEEPASIQYVNAEGGEDSTAVDIALGWELHTFEGMSAETNILALEGEYHRNDLGSKEQNTLTSAVTYLGLFGARQNHVVTASGGYKNDRTKNGVGFTASLAYSPIFPNLSVGKLRDNVEFARDSGGKLHWPLIRAYLVPSAALQYEDADGLTPEDVKGRVERAMGSAQFVVYPVYRYFGSSVELIVTYLFWYNLARIGPFKKYDRNQELFETALNIYLDPTNTFAIGVTYSKGENPDAGRERTTFTSVGLRVKL